MKWVILMLLFLVACSSVPVKDDPWYGVTALQREEYIRYAKDEQVSAIQWQNTENLYKKVLER